MLMAMSVSFTSCSDSDSPDIKDIKGLWTEDREFGYDLLITNDCWIASYGYSLPTLYSFRNAPFKECYNEFGEGDADFGIYRYDKKNNYFLVYWYSDTNSQGEPLFSTEPMVAKTVIEGDKFILYGTWIENIDDYGSVYDKELTYKEIMSKSEYANLPKDVELDDFDYEEYYRYEP